MKMIIIRVTVLTVFHILIMGLFLIFGKMFYNTRDYPMWKLKMEYATKIHDSENVIVGDSRAVAGFVPNILGNNFYNLALGGGSPIEGYYILKEYLKHKKVNKLIISYSPFHLEFNEVFFDRTLKYNFLSTNDLNEIFQKSKELNEKFFFHNDSISNQYKGFLDYYNHYLKAILTQYKFFYYYIHEIRNSFLEMRYFKNIAISNQIKERKGNFDYGILNYSDGENTEAKSNRAFKHNKVIDFYLNQLIILSLQNDIQVFFLATPFNESSYKQLAQNNRFYFKEYSDYISFLKSKYNEVHWYSDIFYYENEYFGDPSHLNPKGQVRFSHYVKEIINSEK